MSQKSLSNWLKGMICGFSICGLVICVLILPMLDVKLSVLAGSKLLYWTWLILLWLSCIPCFVALVFSWRIVSNIGNDRSFIKENAVLLKKISILAFVDSLFVFVWSIVLFFCNMNHPITLLACLFVGFLGVAVAVTFASLSHLIDKASALQDECDLTI